MVISQDKLAEFKKLAADPQGKIYVDRFEDTVRVLIMRGPSSLCAYLGIPVDHPLAGNDYDSVPISCNGGLTFGRLGGKGKSGAGDNWPAGYYWYGWDYAHCDDLCFYALEQENKYKLDSKPWTVKDVEGEIWQAVHDIKRLMTIAERAQRRVK